jgi:hypothetical protein
MSMSAEDHDPLRRKMLLGAAVAGAAMSAASAASAQSRTDTEPRELDGQPMPEPGPVDTALTRYYKRFSETIGETGRVPPEKPSPQETWDIRAPTVPLKVGWLQPDDISPAAVFLASDAAAMVTGAEYQVTGGDSAKDI